MDQDKQARRVKVTEGATHRVGTKRAAVKPHKRTEASSVKAIVTSYLASVKAGSLKQTYTGDTLVKNAVALRTNFGLAANDELFLLLDPTATGRAGMLLAASGVHLADGRGGTMALSYKDLAGSTVAYQRGMLTIGQSGISSTDGQVIAGLLQQIQTKLA